MAGGFRYAGAVGLLLGALFGIVFGLSPGILDLLWGHSHHAQVCLRLYGPINGSIYLLLPFLPMAFVAGWILGLIGYWCGSGLRSAAERKSEGQVEEATQETKTVWPPPLQAQVKGPHDAA